MVPFSRFYWDTFWQTILILKIFWLHSIAYCNGAFFFSHWASLMLGKGTDLFRTVWCLNCNSAFGCFRDVSPKFSWFTKENSNCPNSLLSTERQQLKFHVPCCPLIHRKGHQGRFSRYHMAHVLEAPFSSVTGCCSPAPQNKGKAQQSISNVPGHNWSPD